MTIDARIEAPPEDQAGTGGELSAGSAIERALFPGAHEAPEPDRSAIPYTDADSAQLLDEALAALALIRSPFGRADPGAVLSALVSLGAEADGRLDDAVAEARAAGYGWDAVAERLGAPSARAARRRYGSYCRWREQGCPLPIT